mmetsp:Transcript_20736/g.52501  ORF Transcript_20736/g.52501 Transcript_20736/m.52501 type:complete len:1116 (-) Transcript_20736:2348-5695(-)
MERKRSSESLKMHIRDEQSGDVFSISRSSQEFMLSRSGSGSSGQLARSPRGALPSSTSPLGSSSSSLLSPASSGSKSKRLSGRRSPRSSAPSSPTLMPADPPENESFALYQWGATSPTGQSLYAPSEVPLPALADFACSHHCLAVSTAGSLFVWGENRSGQLGLGHTEPVDKPTIVLFSTRPNIKVDRVFCGPTSSAVVTSDGELFLFGEWNGSTERSLTPQLIALPANTTAVQVSFGLDHCVLLVRDKYSGVNQVFAWGGNELGQLGDESKQRRTASGMVALTAIDESIVQIACGDYFTVALSDRSHVFVWGQNVSKKFESQNKEGFLAPKAATVLKPYRLHNVRSKHFVKIAAGPFNIIALSRDGKVYTWGEGAKFRLGHGDERRVSRPTHVEAFTSPALSIGAGYSFCFALTHRGELHFWGTATRGSFGSGEKAAVSQLPTPLCVDGTVATCLRAHCSQDRVIALLAQDSFTSLADPSSATTQSGSGVSNAFGRPLDELCSEAALALSRQAGADRSAAELAQAGSGRRALGSAPPGLSQSVDHAGARPSPAERLRQQARLVHGSERAHSAGVCVPVALESLCYHLEHSQAYRYTPGLYVGSPPGSETAASLQLRARLDARAVGLPPLDLGDSVDAHAVAATVLAWLRALRSPLLCVAAGSPAEEALRGLAECPAAVLEMGLRLLDVLPRENALILRYLLGHFHKVHRHSDVTGADAAALAPLLAAAFTQQQLSEQTCASSLQRLLTVLVEHAPLVQCRHIVPMLRYLLSETQAPRGASLLKRLSELRITLAEIPEEQLEGVALTQRKPATSSRVTRCKQTVSDEIQLEIARRQQLVQQIEAAQKSNDKIVLYEQLVVVALQVIRLQVELMYIEAHLQEQPTLSAHAVFALKKLVVQHIRNTTQQLSILNDDRLHLPELPKPSTHSALSYESREQTLLMDRVTRLTAEEMAIYEKLRVVTRRLLRARENITDSLKEAHDRQRMRHQSVLSLMSFVHRLSSANVSLVRTDLCFADMCETIDLFEDQVEEALKFIQSTSSLLKEKTASLPATEMFIKQQEAWASSFDSIRDTVSALLRLLEKEALSINPSVTPAQYARLAALTQKGAALVSVKLE